MKKIISSLQMKVKIPNIKAERAFEYQNQN